MDDDWKIYMERLVHRLLLKRDIGAFKDPIDWEGTDYLKVVKRPMDISTVQNRLLDDMYNSREECIQDIRLIWDNAKIYNEPNSKLYALASQMEESFEVMLKNSIPTDEDKPVRTSAMHLFIANCHRIRREELQEILLKLQVICPECIEKSAGDNTLNVEVDLISTSAFNEVNTMIKGYLSYLGGVGVDVTRATDTNGSKRSASAANLTNNSSGSSKKPALYPSSNKKIEIKKKGR